MTNKINRIGLAITFSPTGKALVYEAKRLSELHSAEIIFIHNGERNDDTEKKLFDLLDSTGIQRESFSIEWVQGNIADSLIHKAEEKEADILITGALEKENFVKSYFGSVSRRIMNEAKSSVLILISPSQQPKGFKKFYVSVEYSSHGEKTVETAFLLALKENAEEFILMRDVQLPAISLSIQEGTSIDKVEATRKQLQIDEEQKLDLYIKELNLHGLEIKKKCLYGKEGWEASNYARINRADLFVVTAPPKKFNFLNRIFPRAEEYSFEKLPANLLIVR